MFKMIALFKQPENPKAFDEHYFQTHLPLTAKIPGLQEIRVTKMTGAPRGESPYYLMCEMMYESEEAFQKAAKTPESKASGKDVMTFAGNIVSFMFGEETND